jgi:hypothetical protein
MAPDVPSGVACPLRRASLGGHRAEIVSGAAKVEEPTEVSDRGTWIPHGVKYRATGAGHLTALTRQLTSQALRQEGTTFSMTFVITRRPLGSRGDTRPMTLGYAGPNLNTQ